MERQDTVIIIQARFGSNRLPGKIMKKLGGRPMIWHIVERCRMSKEADKVLVAITISKDDDRVAKFFDKNGIDYFRGPSEDVLLRYLKAAKASKANTIVRVTGDCPFIDPRVIDLCIGKFRRYRCDYISNITPGRRTFPRGLDVEVFSFGALKKAAREARESYEREHVTPYIWENKKNEFRVGPTITASPKYAANYRLTVDYPEDLSLASKIYKKLYRSGTIIDAKEAISFLDKNPKIVAINKHCVQKLAGPPEVAYKILLIGAGSIGMRHFRNLTGLGYKSVAVCDRSRRRLRDVLKFSEGAGVYSDPKEALDKVNPNAVLICTPTRSHLPLARLALKYNADIFIEKPLSYNLRGVDDLIRKAKDQQRIVMVACNWRFRRSWQELFKIIKSQRYGRPVFVRATLGYNLPSARPLVDYKQVYAASKSEGGVILDSGCHFSDYARELFGKIKFGTVVASKLHPLGIQSEEAAHMIFEHRNGITSAVTLDYLSPRPRHLMEVMTDKGLLVLDMRKNALFFDNGRTRRTIYKGRDDINQQFVDEMKHFLDCVRNRKKPIQDLGGAKEALKTILNLRYS